MYHDDDILKVIAGWSSEAGIMCNVYTLQVVTVGIGGQESITASILAWLSGIYDFIVGYQAAGLVYDEVRIVNETQQCEEYRGPWDPTPEPRGTGDYLPSGTAALLTLATGKRKTRGRKYFGPLVEGVQAFGRWAAPVLLDLLEVAALLLGDQTGTFLFRFVVGVLDKNDVFWPFVEAFARHIVAYQRRRKERVGA